MEYYLSWLARKPVFRVSDEVRHKPGCTATEDCWRLEISDLGNRGIVLSLAKTKALISCTVSVQLICAFVFALAKSRFSHDAHFFCSVEILFTLKDIISSLESYDKLNLIVTFILMMFYFVE